MSYFTSRGGGGGEDTYRPIGDLIGGGQTSGSDPEGDDTLTSKGTVSISENTNGSGVGNTLEIPYVYNAAEPWDHTA